MYYRKQFGRGITANENNLRSIEDGVAVFQRPEDDDVGTEKDELIAVVANEAIADALIATLSPELPFTLKEIGNTHVSPSDRFVVSLVVGYDPSDESQKHITTPARALGAALNLIKDEGWEDTNWYCFDRVTGTLHVLEQHEEEGHRRSHTPTVEDDEDPITQHLREQHEEGYQGPVHP
jgi:hypothetical protein